MKLLAELLYNLAALALVAAAAYFFFWGFAVVVGLSLLADLGLLLLERSVQQPAKL